MAPSVGVIVLHLLEGNLECASQPPTQQPPNMQTIADMMSIGMAKAFREDKRHTRAITVTFSGLLQHIFAENEFSMRGIPFQNRVSVLIGQIQSEVKAWSSMYSSTFILKFRCSFHRKMR